MVVLPKAADLLITATAKNVEERRMNALLLAPCVVVQRGSEGSEGRGSHS